MKNLSDLIVRALVGMVGAGLITGRSRERNTLGPGGQWAAFGVGVGTLIAGWEWGALLLVFFLSSSALTNWRRDEKMRRTITTVPQVAERNAKQVLANGFLFTMLALLYLRTGNERWAYGALGAIAAATADTWSTEIGTLFGGVPRSVLTWKRIPVGMSGGITVVGLLASMAGAAIIAGAAVLVLPMPDLRLAAITFVAGMAGGLGDSVAGASLQARRYCDRCREWTERRVHPCGYRTTHRRGFKWMTNDEVNVICTVVGAAVAIVLVRYWRF